MNARPLFFFLLICVFTASHLNAQTTRQKLLFNADWKFYKGEVRNGQDIQLNDQNWRKLELPHDWSIEGPFDQQWASATGYLPGGIGWYRKTFTVDKALQSKNLFIYFDGVYNHSEVWINGHYLGKRPNGYISFEYELTKYLNLNGSNTIAVKVDHSKFADNRWYPGSGIYRNVYLVAVEPVHVSLWGVAFTTPQISKEKASAKVLVSIDNSSFSAASVLVRAQLLDPKGKVVAKDEKQVSSNIGTEASQDLAFDIKNPLLWGVEQPHLYSLNVTLLVNGKKVDDYTEKVGIREIKFTANEGFFLNGENMKLKGVCIHHDAGALGAAVPKEVWERRLKILKESGCNSIRMSHYPHQDYLYDLCDQMGFLVMDEAFDEWELPKNKWIEGWNVGTPGKQGTYDYFSEWSERDLGDMIKRNRNHPSIIMWSIGNEIDYPNDPYTHEILNGNARNPQIFGKGYLPDHPNAIRLGEISKRLVGVAKAIDTSRPITAALAGVVMSNLTEYPGSLDLVGYNYQEFRYKDDHKEFPNRIIYGSENSKGLNTWLAVDSNAFISAQYVWTGFDFMGEAGRWPSRSSGAGILDLAGFPKTNFFLTQSLWSQKPMIYMTATRIQQGGRGGGGGNPVWNWTAGEKIRVSAITNNSEAELFINGKSLGKKAAGTKGTAITWDVDYEPGLLLAKGYNSGKEASSHTLTTTGDITAIQASTDKNKFNSKIKDLAHIDISLTDANGKTVYTAENEITVDLQGPAVLLGLESASLTSHEDYRSNKRKALRGKLLAYVQSTQEAGTIKVIISSPGLSSKTIEIQSK
jgi:beta-galactosidase